MACISFGANIRPVVNLLCGLTDAYFMLVLRSINAHFVLVELM